MTCTKTNTITHDLKTWPEFFTEVEAGRKTFEVRLYDRPYKIGDLLKLREWVPGTKEYTGRVCFRKVTYLTVNSMFVLEGYCIMGLAKPSNPVNSRVLRDQVRDLMSRPDAVGEIIELVLRSLV